MRVLRYSLQQKVTPLTSKKALALLKPEDACCMVVAPSDSGYAAYFVLDFNKMPKTGCIPGFAALLYGSPMLITQENVQGVLHLNWMFDDVRIVDGQVGKVLYYIGGVPDSHGLKKLDTLLRLFINIVPVR